MARYTSNRFKDLIIGLSNYSELKTALQVVGRVGIGTNDAKTPLWIEGNTNIAGIITATVFKKEGGTNSQFLMADGSINNLSYLTEESDTLDDVLGRGNSSTKNLSVGVITSTNFVGGGSGLTGLTASQIPILNQDTTGTAANLSGTPSIVVDQITANNVSVAQTLTYEDVTSVDSVGIVTAGKGLRVTTGGLVVTSGVSTFAGVVRINNNEIDTATGNLTLDSAGGTTTIDDHLTVVGVTTIGNVVVGGATTDLIVDGNARVTGILSVGTGTVVIDDTTVKTGTTNVHSVGIEVAGINVLGADTPIGTGATIYNSGAAIFTGVVTATSFVGDGSSLDNVGVGTDGSINTTGIITATSFVGDGSGLTGTGIGTDGSVNTTGIITATSFVGSGASLTDLPAGELTGTVADARINSLTASKLTGTVADARINSLTASKLTGPLPAISGANLTNVYTTDDGGRGTDLVVTGISSLGIATSGDSQPGKTDLYYQGDLKLKTTQQGVEVIGIMSATALDFTGATGAFNNDVLLQGATANANWDKSHSILQFFDGAKAVFGSEPLVSDLEIYHDGQNSFINEIGTGDLFITTGIGTTAAKVSDGSITLYHQGVERLKTTSSGLIISGSVTGSLGGDLDGNAATASDLNIGATQQLVIQTGNNNTEAFSTGTAGQILQSNGPGNAPTWEDAAPADFTGLTLRQDGSIVGTANSVSTVNFTGDGASVVFTDNNSGIATVTISGGGSGASSVMMSMIF